MDAGGTRFLGETGDVLFDFAAGDHHEVGQLVDDHDDIGKVAVLQGIAVIDNKGDRIDGILVLFALLDNLFQLFDNFGVGERTKLLLLEQFSGQFLVVRIDIAHALVGEELVAALHLVYRPFQRQRGLLRLGYDRQQQVRNPFVHGELQHLGVDHDHAHILGGGGVEQGEDHRVDRDRFAGAG